MWKYVLIFLLVISILLVLFSNKKYAENFRSEKPFEFVQVAETPPPEHNHDFDTECFPKFPTPLYSIYHNIHVAQKLQNMEKCGDCEKLEMELVNRGKSYFRKGKSEKPKTEDLRGLAKCEACHLLLDTWNRYFNSVESIVHYINTGNLPEPPKIDLKCKGCEEVQKKCRDYAKKVREETESIIQGKSYKKVRIPEHKYESQEKCCEEVYNTWTLYTIDLLNIGQYVLCNKWKV